MKKDHAELVFRIRALTKTYQMGEGQVLALRGIDLDLYAGEFIVLLGASGSGKSTLLNIMGGLDKATTGNVLFHGLDLTKAEDKVLTEYRRAHIGFVFQFYNLIPSLTASENIEMVTDIASNPLSPAKALEMVGLQQRKNHFPSQLSGGEQQRVAIARAVSKQPEIMLCDEPTGALDSKTGIIVLEALDSINKQLGATTVVITHNAAIADMADRVLKLSDGLITDSYANNIKKLPQDLIW